jgi:hypothetical protein
MNPRLARSLHNLNERKGHLMAQLESCSPERLCFRPSDEAWCALELLEHLMLSERAVLATMKQNLRGGKRVTLRDRFLSGRVLAITLLPTRLRVPRQASAILPSGKRKDLAALNQDWTDHRKSLADFLESLSDVQRTQGLFRHPFGGWTTAHGALLFVHVHFRHHGYQVARIRRATDNSRTPP